MDERIGFGALPIPLGTGGVLDMCPVFLVAVVWVGSG